MNFCKPSSYGNEFRRNDLTLRVVRAIVLSIKKLNRLLDEQTEELSAELTEELAEKADTNFDELRKQQKEDCRKAVVKIPEYAEPIN